MNDTLRLLHSHRSIRRYTDEDVADEDLREAVDAARRASTSSAIEAYCAIRVRDPATRNALAELTGGQSKVARAGAFLVICGDTRRHRLACQQHGTSYDARLEAFVLAVVDTSIFAQSLCVALESMGYGICYIGGLRNRLDDVDRLLELPEGVYPLYGLCVGRPDQEPLPRPRLPLDAVLVEERYPDDDRVRELLAEHDVGVEAYYKRREIEGRTWTAMMADKFSVPRRTEAADYYARKGARLD